MHQAQALLLGLLTCLLGGCLTEQPLHPPSSWMERLRLGQGPGRPDVVVMEVALLERPVGDEYINKELWALTDEQTIPLERKSLLEDNGLRIGQVGGIPPARLLALLTSKRSCANPRRIYLTPQKPFPIALGPRAVSCHFEMEEDGELVPIDLEQAECSLSVVPSLTDNGQIRLRFTPQIRHGEVTLMPQPAPDRHGWVLQETQPTEVYSSLAWEVTLPPEEYVVVGGRFDRPRTLGHQFFIRADETVPVQRLLVLRTRCLAQDRIPGSCAADEEEPTASRSLPLAVQAAYSAPTSDKR